MESGIEIFGVPMDLGANVRGSNIGPSAMRIAGLSEQLRKMNLKAIDRGDIQVPVREQVADSVVERNFLPVIKEVCAELADSVYRAQTEGHRTLTLGGDHSLAIGSIAGTARAFREAGKTLGVIWVDAHADLNTPHTSPSGNIHGMPLAVALGQGHEELVQLGGQTPMVQPENVALIGIRNIDGAEKKLVRHSKVLYYTMRTIDERGMYAIMQEVVADLGNRCDGIHLSFDLDGVDPLYAPGVSTAVTGGLSYREAHLLLEVLADTGKLAAIDMVELNPIQDETHKTALLAVELIASALGNSII